MERIMRDMLLFYDEGISSCLYQVLFIVTITTEKIIVLNH